MLPAACVDLLHMSSKPILVKGIVGVGKQTAKVACDWLTVVVVVDVTNDLSNEGEVFAGEVEFSCFVD